MPYDVILLTAPGGALSRPAKRIAAIDIAAERAHRELERFGRGAEAYIIESGRSYRSGDPYLIGYRRTDDRTTSRIRRHRVEPEKAEDVSIERFANLELDELPTKASSDVGIHEGHATEQTITHQPPPQGQAADGQAQSITETVRVDAFTESPASVKVSLGRTINLGNYESARVDVCITMPCHPADVERAYEDVRRRVEDKLLIEVESAKRRPRAEAPNRRGDRVQPLRRTDLGPSYDGYDDDDYE